MLKDMKRKYRMAAKEIFELEKVHEEEKERLGQEYLKVSKENMINRAVINTLFTEKQFQHLVSLGSWEEDVGFKLPAFYFKDKNTLAFPYESKSEANSDSDLKKTNGFKRSNPQFRRKGDPEWRT